jgi:LmbE family N-acetylglucosaminyl deacetylase
MGAEEALTRQETALVVAHPDDETIGAGGLLPRMLAATLVYITDGAPRDLADARRAGFETAADYASARRTELLNALAEAGLSEDRLRFLGIPDQGAAFALPGIARRLETIFEETGVAAVLTHSYEGGHPDHDSTALAVHAACARMRRPPAIWEFAGYHAHNGSMATGEFLIGATPGEAIVMSEEARERKRRMFECFATQRDMLRNFPIDVERFRPAPVYDFRQPPHPGRLFYEQFEWGVNGERWRALALAALAELGLEATL